MAPGVLASTGIRSERGMPEAPLIDALVCLGPNLGIIPGAVGMEL